MSHPSPADPSGAPATPAAAPASAAPAYPGGFAAPGALFATDPTTGAPVGFPAPGQPAPGAYAAPGAYPAAQPVQTIPAPYAGQPGAYPGAQPAAYPAPQPGQHIPAPYSGQHPGYPAAQPGLAPQGMLACRFCGSVPAAQVKFRGHQGLLVIMRFLHTTGPFCRDCGLGVFRQMTSRTLVQGWYSYGSFVITPITVLVNLFRRNTVANLPAPQPNPHGPSRPPMDPGPRLLERPMTWLGLLIPFALIALLIFAASQN